MSQSPDSVQTPEAEGATAVASPPEEPKVNGKPKKGKKPAAEKKPPKEKPKKGKNKEKTDWTAWPTMMVPIAEIDTSERFRKRMTKIDELALSIDQVGQLQPIVVGPKDPKSGLRKLYVGGRRVEAIGKKLKRTEIWAAEADYINDAAKADELILRAELDENEHRVGFDVDEKLALVTKLEALIGPAHQKGGHAKRRKKIAAAVDLSHESVRQLKAIKQAATENPEKFGGLMEDLRESNTSINKAFKELQRLQLPETDAAGFFLPEGNIKVAEIWQAAPYFKECLSFFQKGKHLLNTISQDVANHRILASGRLRTRGGATEDASVSYSHEGLDELLLLVKRSAPYSQCPTCAGASGELGVYDKKCPTCLGGGHIGEKEFTALEDAKDDGVKALKKLSEAEGKKRKAAKK